MNPDGYPADVRHPNGDRERVRIAGSERDGAISIGTDGRRYERRAGSNDLVEVIPEPVRPDPYVENPHSGLKPTYLLRIPGEAPPRRDNFRTQPPKPYRQPEPKPKPQKKRWWQRWQR